MPVFGAAATTALGKIFVRHFETGGTLEDLEPEAVKESLRGEVEEAIEEAEPTSAETTPAEKTEVETTVEEVDLRHPRDVVGPGWAFAKTEAARDEEGLHKEARRQARLLVLEIKLYCAEAVEEGRKSGNIYHRLKDDIDRTRQLYEERIDPRLRDNAPDYYRQELIERLAGGDERLLGDQGASAAEAELTSIKGIGPKFQGILEAEGIETLDQLAAAEVSELEAILEKHKMASPLHNPADWRNQARAAVGGVYDDVT